LWQRNYYEHVVRNSLQLRRVRRYIASNPSRWELDRENQR
jgi:putative transposase